MCAASAAPFGHTAPQGHAADIPRDYARPASPAISDVNQHFESLWALYPVKRGKQLWFTHVRATAIDTTDLKGQGLPFQLEELPF